MAGQCRFQRTNITCGLRPSSGCCCGLRRGCRLYWSRSRRLFWCWRRSRSRCLRARHRGSWFSTLRRLCYRLRLRFHGCLRFFRFNHRLLTSWARSGRTFSGLRFRRVTRCIAIANRRNRCGFSRQRGIDRHIVQLLLILWLGQRIVQVTLHFNTLLTIRCHRGLPLSRRRRDRWQRNILLSIFRRRGSRRWLHAIRLIGRIASKINTLLARRGLIAGSGRGGF